ncbi:MAG: hypothetical protein M3285_13600 [Actinomycetota bacterium]|nr:hypothetical protein [Actinomycetota bacterium]
MTRTPVRRATLSVIVGALFLGSCGGGGTSADEWATDVCNGLKDFVSEISETQADVQAAVSPESTPEQGRELLNTTFDSMIESTDSLIGKIEAAGTPDIEGGEDIQNSLISGLEDMKTALEDAQPRIDALPDDPTEFKTEAAEIGSDLQTELQGIGDTLSAMDAPELEEETQDVEACQDVGT